MIAMLIIVYVAIALVLFKVLRIKPTAYIIAAMIVAGVFMIGGVVVVWTQSAPITDKMVTSQYVVQLVPYVKGQVKTIHAEANQRVKKGDLLLEIDPAPYQYTVNQVEAQLAASKANVGQAEAAVRTAQSNVPAVEAQLDEARFNLSQCKMTAPGDGYVTNWQVQIGTMLVPLPLAPAGTFVNVSGTAVAAVFPQNWLSNVEPGDDVEMVLNPYPGRLFLGKVDYVIPATGGGQFAPTGTIPNAAKIGSDGLYAVRINFTDVAVARKLSIGSGGSAAIYTQKGKATHVISKVTIRMKKWLLYVIPTVEKPSS